MRIENNNVSFGAYFKNNKLFRDAYCESFRQVDKKILDRFVKECPNHEIEIISKTPALYGKKIKNDYTVFNNMTGGYYEISANDSDRPLDRIMKKLIGLNAAEDGKKEGAFWKNSPMIDNFKALTGIK